MMMEKFLEGTKPSSQATVRPLEMLSLFRRVSEDLGTHNAAALLVDLETGLQLFGLDSEATQLKTDVAAVKSGDWAAILSACGETLQIIAAFGEAASPNGMANTKSAAECCTAEHFAKLATDPSPATGLLNKLYMARVRIKAAKKAAIDNPGKVFFFDTLRKANAIPDATLSAKASEIGIPVGTLGDGTIWATIVAFFQTPQGQALEAALIKAILLLLGIAAA